MESEFTWKVENTLISNPQKVERKVKILHPPEKRRRGNQGKEIKRFQKVPRKIRLIREVGVPVAEKLEIEQAY